MKKFHFSLERMRSYKEQMLETQKNALRTLRHEKQQLDDRIEAYRAEMSRANRELLRKTHEGISVVEVKSYRFQIENMRLQLEELGKEQKRMERMVERQMQVVLEAQQEVSGLDKLEEKQLEEYQRDVMRADEQLIAEFISTKLAMQKDYTHAS
ncbi:MAG: hypothetical protein HFG27_01335 [Provencibacterium sp.]|jgi:flagellar export protein FliJ|nr:hypothetical protein [Provencibacterium sp.]